MASRTLGAWSWLHTWSSLVSTAFLLLLCLTGLPLVFHHQIGAWLGSEVVAPVMPTDAPRATLAAVLASAQARFPAKVALYASQEPDDDRVWYVTMGDSPHAGTDLRQVAVDARTGRPLAEPRIGGGVMGVLHSLHVDLLAGPWGRLFLGAMGLLMLVAIVSGAVLYAPFMRRLRFGEVRRARSPRLKWLDRHNLLGVVTLTWALVVAATGVVNTWADLVVAHWRNGAVAELLARDRGQAPPLQRAPLDTVLANARMRAPDMRIAFIAFPGTAWAGERHYGVFMRGRTASTARLLRPVLVDAATGEAAASREPPWTMKTLLLSQPLHFGDYGGVPLQCLWALLDVLTIVVLASGLWLWHGRRGPASGRRSAAA